MVVLEKGCHARAAELSLLERDAFARLYEGAGLITTTDSGARAPRPSRCCLPSACRAHCRRESASLPPHWLLPGVWRRAGKACTDVLCQCLPGWSGLCLPQPQPQLTLGFTYCPDPFLLHRL